MKLSKILLWLDLNKLIKEYNSCTQKINHYNNSIAFKTFKDNSPTFIYPMYDVLQEYL